MSNIKVSIKEESASQRDKRVARLIVRLARKILKKKIEKTGILLCEGYRNSIDYIVYSRVYKCLEVIPIGDYFNTLNGPNKYDRTFEKVDGGCTAIIKIISKVRKLLSKGSRYKTYGIIDRDGLSKVEIKRLLNDYGIYCTKLPFIENVICAPEVIEILCRSNSMDYTETMRSIQEDVMRHLWRKICISLPINMYVSDDETIKKVNIHVMTSKKRVDKNTNMENIIYIYRDKAIASIVSQHFNRSGRKKYYEFIEMALNGKYEKDLVHCMRALLPKII